MSPSLQSASLFSHLVHSRSDYKITIHDEKTLDIQEKPIVEEKVVEKDNSVTSGFTVIIVTYNEPLLFKTYDFFMRIDK